MENGEILSANGLGIVATSGHGAKRNDVKSWATMTIQQYKFG
jgi:hypothetical protein